MNIYQKIVANLVSSELSTKYNFFDLQKNVLKSYAIEQIKKEYGEKVKNVQFLGGCRGNTQGVARLCENMDIDEVITRLKGIQCRANTSCPNELAKALEEYKANNM